MGLTGPVLVATDLSTLAETALRQGHAIAKDLSTPLIVCHVLPEAFKVRVLFPQDAGIDAPMQAQLQQKAAAVLAMQIATVLGKDAGAVIEIESGTPHAGIQEVAERVGAGLIVVGPGATALRVTRSASYPVLIARPSPAGAVLCATDFSDPYFPAVNLAAAEARRRKAGLRLIHCLDIDATAYLASAGLPGIAAMPPVPESLMKELEASARDRLQAALTSTGTPGEIAVLEKTPARGIVEAAQDPAAALLVVGTRGRTGLSRLALGSVAEYVVEHAPCSVLVVPLHVGE